MYVNGMGFRAIEQVTGIHHTSIIIWGKPVRQLLPDACDPELLPEVAELNELENLLDQKSKICLWMVVEHF
jgi:hypothetical protein